MAKLLDLERNERFPEKQASRYHEFYNSQILGNGSTSKSQLPLRTVGRHFDLAVFNICFILSISLSSSIDVVISHPQHFLRRKSCKVLAPILLANSTDIRGRVSE